MGGCDIFVGWCKRGSSTWHVCNVSFTKFGVTPKQTLLTEISPASYIQLDRPIVPPSAPFSSFPNQLA